MASKRRPQVQSQVPRYGDLSFHRYPGQIAVRIDKKRGKGSHQTLYFGNRKTIIRNPKDKLKTDTYHAKAARPQHEGLEMTAMNLARDLRIVWKL